MIIKFDYVLYKNIYVNYGAPHFTKARVLGAPCASSSMTTLRLGAP